MIRRPYVLACILVASVACESKPRPTKTNARVATGCRDTDMEPSNKFLEGTQPEMSGLYVGIGNIYEHERKDLQPAQKELGAELFIHDPTTKAESRDVVFAGSLVNLGTDRYCVVEIGEGVDSESGWIKLGKLK